MLEHAQQVPAAPPRLAGVATVRGQIEAAGINPDTASERLRQGWVRVDGDVVTDGEREAGTRVTFCPPGVTEHTPDLQG